MRSVKPAVYVLVRIPKTGSTSCLSMMQKALPDARTFSLPKHDAAEDESWSERPRAARNRVRNLFRDYGVLTFSKAWQYIDCHARDGDMVAGHIRYSDPVLPNLQLRYVTLLRDPLERTLSEYNYARVGYQKRNFAQRAYQFGRLGVAGTRSFSDYLSYLDEHTNGDANLLSAYTFGKQQPADPLGFLCANYFHFGVLERFALFAAGLSRKLGVTVHTEKKNVTPRREAHALNRVDRPLFERICSRDIALYEAVIAHLNIAADG